MYNTYESVVAHALHILDRFDLNASSKFSNSMLLRINVKIPRRIEMSAKKRNFKIGSVRSVCDIYVFVCHLGVFFFCIRWQHINHMNNMSMCFFSFFRFVTKAGINTQHASFTRLCSNFHSISLWFNNELFCICLCVCLCLGLCVWICNGFFCCCKKFEVMF